MDTNNQDFFTALLNSIPNLTQDYLQIINANNQNKLGSVLTNPNTTAGKIYTTGQAFNSASTYNMVIMLAAVILIVFILFKKK